MDAAKRQKPRPASCSRSRSHFVRDLDAAAELLEQLVSR